jgi:hypothetical protein
MDPIQHHAVAYHDARLTREAETERLGAARRRSLRAQHAAHPRLSRANTASAIRRTVGRFLINLGGAIAGGVRESGTEPAHAATGGPGSS